MSYRDRQNEWNRENSKNVRDIGAPPPVTDPGRRAKCRYDLREYLLTYHPSAFPYDFSPDHETLIRQAQNVILEGGRFVTAMPRGSGKTTIFQRAEIWAALYGHRIFPMLLTADDKKFRRLLRGIKSMLETNELLYQDFPEICHPVRALERVALRANYQLCNGDSTFISWGSSEIVLPTTEYTIEKGNAGIIVSGGGLTGAAVRGGVVTTPQGEQRRPDAVLIDDPQTRRTAKSDSANEEREDIINGDVLGMAGPGKDIAALCTVTVIYQTDLASRLLDNKRSPRWKKLRVRCVKSWPENMDLWEQYADIERQETQEELPAGAATQFYENNRQAMDEGAEVYWEDRIDPGHISAIQSAMSKYFANPRSFLAEMQNDPEEDLSSDALNFDPLVLARRTVATKRGDIDANITTLISHIDVQGEILFWSLWGFTEQFGSRLVDFGTTPDQKRAYFTLNDLRLKLSKKYPDHDEAGMIRQGIIDTIQMLSDRQYVRTDGALMRLNLGLVDARFKTDDVEEAIIEADRAGWMPAYGVGIGAKDKGLHKWSKKRGVRKGYYWIQQKPDRRLLVSAFYDTNHWKTDGHGALTLPVAHSQSAAFFKAKAHTLQMYADHTAAEVGRKVEVEGRSVYEWATRKKGIDNHLFDNFVACRAGASMVGLSKRKRSKRDGEKKKPKRNRVSKLKV